MIDVVPSGVTVVDHDHAAHHAHEVFCRKCADFVRYVETQPAVQLVTAYASKVILAGVEEEIFEQRRGVFDAGRLARAQSPVELEQRLGLVRDRRVARQRRIYVLMRWVDVHFFKEGADLLVGLYSQSSQESGDGRFALAVHFDREKVPV